MKTDTVGVIKRYEISPPLFYYNFVSTYFVSCVCDGIHSYKLLYYETASKYAEISAAYTKNITERVPQGTSPRQQQVEAKSRNHHFVPKLKKQL